MPQELGGVVGLRHPGRQGVPRRLRGRDPDHPPHTCCGPCAADTGQRAGLPAPGRGIDHHHPPVTGQRRVRRCRLVHPQPGLRDLRVRGFCVPAQRGVELRGGTPSSRADSSRDRCGAP